MVALRRLAAGLIAEVEAASGRSTLDRVTSMRAVPALDAVVYGRGGLGDKVRQLLLHTDMAARAGFARQRRRFFPEGFFDPQYQGLGWGRDVREAVAQGAPMDQAAAAKALLRAGLTSDQRQILSTVCDEFRGCGLAIRSSGIDHALGTGTFRTRIAPARVAAVAAALSQVLASNFGADAAALRSRLGSDGEFGVIIEPLIGQEIAGEESFDDDGQQLFPASVWAPIISGSGFSSTAYGPAELRVWPGLGGGVEERAAELMTRAMVERHGGSLIDYIDAEYERIVDRAREDQTSLLLRYERLSIGLGSRKDHWMVDGFRPDAVADGYGDAAWCNVRDRFEPAAVGQIDYEALLARVTMAPFFDAVARLEALADYPLYFEWAITADPEPRWGLTQIAPARQFAEDFAWAQQGELWFRAHTVKVAGQFLASGLVICYSADALPALRAWNAAHHNYLLLYTGNLTSRLYGSPLRLADFAAAGAVYELPYADHTGDPAAHFGGQFTALGIPFGVMRREDYREVYDLLTHHGRTQDGLTIVPGRFQVLSSEARREALVSYLGE